MTQGGEGSSVCSGNTEEAKLSNPSEIAKRRRQDSRNRKDPEEVVEVAVAAIRKTLVMCATTGLREATVVAHPPAAREAQATMIRLPMETMKRARPQKAAMTASSSMTTQRPTTANMPMLRTTRHRVTPIMDKTVAMEAETSSEDQVRPLAICGATLMATDRAEAPI